MERGLTRLASDESHPSLRVHKLHGEFEGEWSASISDVLRVRYRKLPGGRKLLLDLTHHYDD